MYFQHCGVLPLILTELDKTDAAVWYNKACKLKQLTSNCICIKIKRNNTQYQKTIKAPTLYRLNQKLKFLYVKNQTLKEQLYEVLLT
jgi:TPR repeat protein